MAPNPIETLVRRWIDDVYNKKNLDVIDDVMTSGTVHHGLDEIGPGRLAFKHYLQRFIDAFPDLYVSIEDLRWQGDIVEVRGTNRATHKGTWAGHKATDKKVEWGFHSRLRVVDGKIVETWSEAETERFMQAISEQPEEEQDKDKD